MNCGDLAEPLNALLDGELSPHEAANVTTHLAGCLACAKLFSELAQLRANLVTLIPRDKAPAELRARIEAMLDREENSTTAKIIQLTPKSGRRRLQNYGWLAAITAIAAMLILVALLRHDNINELMSVRDAALRSSISSGAIATVNGPTVQGYKLIDFRNDEVAGHPAQVAQYAANGQVFTLCIWPAYDKPPHDTLIAAYKGMTIANWADGENEFWAVSTAPEAQLQAFILQASTS